MKSFRQARWMEPSIFELGCRERGAHRLPQLGENVEKVIKPSVEGLPRSMLREEEASLPEVSEGEVVRHYTRLSQQNFGVDTVFYPLGSCTMKYNPKVNDALANLDPVRWLHPYQDESTVQGALEIMYKLSLWLSEITGMHSFTTQPLAGANGEFTGTLIMRAFHSRRGQLEDREEMIVPDSAHGTNLASANMAGFKVVIVPSNDKGCVDLDALRNAVSDRTAGLMLTNPNTLGIFEENIAEISHIIHEAGGLLYYDGANLNAVLGKARPGDMGFDIVHLNLHKTFSTPHGGGGPGSGPVGVVEELEEFLPVPTVGFDGERFYLNYNHRQTIGKVGGFYGNFEVLVRAFTYLLSMGADGLKRVAEISVLNANYLARRITEIDGFSLPFDSRKLRKHEFVISCSKMKADTGISARNVAKRLLDYGVHAPTMYFPSIVEEALMIEPTETESIEELDRYVEVFAEISREAYKNPELVLKAPHNTTVRALDEVKASHPRTMVLSWRMRMEEAH